MFEFELRKAVHFEAAHYFPDAHDPKQRRLHGHSFRLEVSIAGPGGDDDKLLDFGDFSRILARLVDELDHRTLNEIAGLENPTLENLCCWIADRLGQEFAGKLRRVAVSRPSLAETCILSL